MYCTSQSEIAAARRKYVNLMNHPFTLGPFNIYSGISTEGVEVCLVIVHKSEVFGDERYIFTRPILNGVIPDVRDAIVMVFNANGYDYTKDGFDDIAAMVRDRI